MTDGPDQASDRALRLHVIGAGLIGTSIALAAAAAGWTVSIGDLDELVQERASRLLGRQPPDPHGGPPAATTPDLVCVAVPPAAVSAVMQEALGLYLDATVMDVSSVKVRPQQDLQTHGADLTRVVWTHPLAGSERSGPDAAAPDLFAGRTWVICPGDSADRVDLVDEVRRNQVLALVQVCGGRPLELSAAVHDRLLAYTSHLPQLIASALAAEVAAAFVAGNIGVPPEGGEVLAADVDGPTVAQPDPGVPAELSASPSLLAGPGLLDMTRLAASPPGLWSDVAALNHDALRGALGALLRRLDSVRTDLTEPHRAAAGVRALVESGGAGRRQLDRKHSGAAGAPRGRSDASWTWVRVVIDDVPGTLARVFALAADLGINIEDVHVDHAPHASRGEVSVAVAAADAPRLQQGLAPLPPTAP